MTPDEKLKCEIGELILELFNFPMATFFIERAYEGNGEQDNLRFSAVLGSVPASEGFSAVPFDPIRIVSSLKAIFRVIQRDEWKLTYGPHLEMEQYRLTEGEEAYREGFAW